ncbi:unnamed protein product, partial [Staurois parvus]
CRLSAFLSSRVVTLTAHEEWRAGNQHCSEGTCTLIIRALISATCQCPSVPASVLIHATCQCHINTTYQCPSELPFSVTHQCQSVSPINASQCHLSVLPISAAYQCQSVLPISAA